MAGRTVNMGYLFYIELLKGNCIDEASAISGQEILRHLNAVPLSYRKKWAPWFVEDFMMIAGGARNVHDQESLDFLVCNAQKFPDCIDIACNSDGTYENKRSFFTAKYWLYNVREKGQRFSDGGIGEGDIETHLAMIGTYPLKGLTELSQINNDYDCWDYVKTWLDNNWRRPDQIPKRSLQEIRDEIFKRLRGISTV